MGMMDEYVIFKCVEESEVVPRSLKWMSMLGGSQSRPGRVCFEYLIETLEAESAEIMDYATNTFYLVYVLPQTTTGSPTL